MKINFWESVEVIKRIFFLTKVYRVAKLKVSEKLKQYTFMKYMTVKKAWIALMLMFGASFNLSAADIVDLSLENQSGATQNNAVTTFGQVFTEGEIAAGVNLSARLSGGTNVPLQVDKKATHNDGSLRHAILTARIPSLGSGGDTLTLSTGGNALGGSAVSLNDVLASNFDAQVNLNVGGTIYSASAKNLLQNATPTTWLSGSLVSEWLVGAPVKTQGGAAHDHLTAYFHVRAYAGTSQVRVDVVIENNWTLVSGPRDISYDAEISVGDSSVYTSSLNHRHQSRWHQAFWWGTEPAIYVKHDNEYLKATKAIPNYLPLTPSESKLDNLTSAIVPMNNADLTDNFENTGAQQQIGPMHHWASLYAVSMDRRAFLATLRNDSGGAAYTMHYRDKTTGNPVSIDDHPTLSEQFDNLPACGGSCGSPYAEDVGHSPLLGYMSYLVTGDYFYLEELQFWAVWTFLNINAEYRNYSDGLWYTGSVRGQGWSYRTLGYTAYITPDSHPLKAHFEDKIATNLANDIAKYVSPGGSHKTVFGTIFMGEGNDQYRTWMDDFFTWAVGNLVDLGYTAAQPLLEYKVKFPIGRMGEDASGAFCFQFASKYTHRVGPSAGEYYSSWDQVAAASAKGNGACGSQALADWMSANLGDSYVINQITGYQSGTDGYYSNMQPALAMAAQSGVAGGSAAWAKSQLSSVQPDYADNPNFAVVPRDISNIGPLISFSSNASSVQEGGSVTLTWNASSADSCTASGDWSGAKAVSGSQAITSITVGSAFTLSCTNSNGTRSRTVNISLQASEPPPVPTPSDPPPSDVTDTTAPSVPAGLNWVSVNSTQIDLTWSASSDNNGGSGLFGYNVYRDGALLESVTGTSSSDVVLAAGSDYQYGVSAVDNAGNESVVANVTATTATGGQVVARINAGGGAYTDSFGREWSADTGANTGNVGSSSNSIAGSSEDALFQSQRWDSGAAPELVYSIDVDNGGYTVNLYFTEYYSGAFGDGLRTFDVNLEGDTVLNGLDVYAEAGRNSALVRSVSTTVSDGQLNIEFIHGVENTMISAIEILQDNVTDTAPVVNFSANPTSVIKNGSTVLIWSSENASSCLAGGDWSGIKGVSGSETVDSLTVDHRFTLTCTGAGGSIQRELMVRVANPDGGTGDGTDNPSNPDEVGAASMHPLLMLSWLLMLVFAGMRRRKLGVV